MSFMISRRHLLASGAALLAAPSLPALAQGQFKAATTFTVIADIAQNVAGNAAIIESITKPGAEIHNYQPTPGDIRRAQDANLILWNGLNLELWFERFFQNLRNVPSVVVSDGVEPMGIAEGPYTGKPNPHAWMSPANALIRADNPDMTDEQIAYSIEKLNEYGIVDSREALELGIGAMTDERWHDFFQFAADAGLYPKDLDLSRAYTLQFVNKKVGMELKK